MIAEVFTFRSGQMLRAFSTTFRLLINFNKIKSFMGSDPKISL